jgi:hypothetical protein
MSKQKNSIGVNKVLTTQDYKNMWRWIKSLVKFKGNNHFDNQETSLIQLKVDLVNKLMKDLRIDNFYDFKDKILYKLNFNF